MQSKRAPHARLRSSSDPFLDPIYVPHSDIPSPLRSAPLSAPAPPPKSAPTKKIRHPNDTRDPRMLEAAVRDTVTVRAVDQPTRMKVARSHTAAQPSTPTPKPSSPVQTRRSYSQDSVTQAANVVEKARKSTKPSKKGSTHADVIDRLDFTAGGPMFHHDGPFDACAPSRNRHKTKAPMLAWSSPVEVPNDPVSAAQLRADRRLAPVDNIGGSYDSPYPAFGYSEPTSYSPPKKQVDRIAEAWGIHEPEPYEEFFAGGTVKPEGETGLASAASSIHGSKEASRGASSRKKQVRDGREIREQFKGYLDEGRPQLGKRTTTRSNLPPPAPIFLSDEGRAEQDVPPPLPSPGFVASPGGPKRTKSLMHRIRKMRDAPNVPVDASDPLEEDVSPPSSLENYTSTPDGNNSFFGRFGRNTSAPAHLSPVSPTSETSDQYVYVDDPKNKKNKALPPPPPHESPATSPIGEKIPGYFDSSPVFAGTPGSPGAGLGRRTSLLRKVKGVVRAGGNK